MMMDSVFFSEIGWVLALVGVVGIGFFVRASLGRLPNMLDMEISRRVEKSIVIEHDTQAGRT